MFREVSEVLAREVGATSFTNKEAERALGRILLEETEIPIDALLLDTQADRVRSGGGPLIKPSGCRGNYSAALVSNKRDQRRRREAATNGELKTASERQPIEPGWRD